MKTKFTFTSVLAILIIFIQIQFTYGQCTNTSSYGSATAPLTQTPVTITTCAFPGEYSTINGCVAGSSYVFTATGGTGNYITIHQGTPGGAVLGYGFSPITVTCTASGPLYLHLNTNASCGTESSCHTETVALAPPPACTNSSAFGSTNAPTTSTPITITTCGYAGEYSTVNNCVAGSAYLFTSTGGTGNYITIRQGTPGGTVLGAGNSPITVTCTVSGPLYIHVNTNSSCGTDASCHTRTVALAPPPACTNSSAFGSVNAPLTQTPVTITTCGYAGEYSTVNNCVAGSAYVFTSTGGTGNYITIRQGTPGGTVLGAGNSPITVTCTVSGPLYIHVNTNSSCGTDASCHTRTVALAPPPTCNNTIGYGTVSAPTTATPVTISSCNYADEYGTVTGCVAGTTYQFTATGGSGNYLTIRQGTPGGTVLGSGFSPVTVTCTVSGPLYSHINTNASCGTDATCHTSQVSCTSCASCVPTITVTESSGTANNGVICTGSSATLSVPSGATSYLWNTGATTSSITVSPTATTTYLVIITGGSCPGNALTVITVSGLPVATAAATPSTLCAGQSINLSSSGGTSYSWSGPGGWTSTLQNPVRTNATVAMAGTYNVTVTNSNGCTATASVDVTVNALPTAYAEAGPNPTCSGKNVRFKATGGTSYSWSGPGGFTSTEQDPYIGNVQTSHAGVYTVTVTNAAGCTATATVTLVVNQTPNGVASVSPSPVCVGNQAFFTASGGNSYLWSGPNGFTSTQQNPILNITSHLQGGIYYVVISNSNGCSVRLQTDLKVIYPPVATASHEANTACTGKTLKLHATGAGTYSWTGPAGFTSTLKDPQIPNATAANSGVYTVVVTALNGCTASASTTVTVVNPPVVTATVDDNTLCEGSTAYLHSSGAVSYAWVGPYGYASNYQNPTIYYIPTYMSGLYTVTGNGPTGCQSSASVTINVYGNINGSASANPNPIAAGNNLQLSANGGTQYLWTGPNGFHSTDQNPLIYNVNSSHTGTYTVIISNEGGCQYTLFVNVQVLGPKGGKEGSIEITSTKLVEGHIYPNPANSVITLQRHAESAIVYSIIDIKGNVIVKNATSHDGQVNIETLSVGTYNVLWSQPGVVEDAFKGVFVKVQ
jgi:hypothetical protein